mmetsp:Transcript_31569/g.72143  ORF Transcript_31569/g.72143 Transcript_31569/m.72143 type:complete len:183 (-) Transcript_31569:125-673(-)
MSGGKRRMDEEPDPSGEAVREELEVDPTEARSQGLAFAAARIIQMALQTQAEALATLAKQDPSALESAASWGFRSLAADPGAASGPGAQPFLVACKVLRTALGEEACARVHGADGTGAGARLVTEMKAWGASQVDAARADELRSFADEHQDEPGYFTPGDHLGGECENAIYDWTDAAISLVN